MGENPDTAKGVARWAAPRRVQDVGAFVTTVRRDVGLTQAQLAERAGLPRRFVNELETGHTTQFVDRLTAVLRELGIRVVLEAGPPAETRGRGLGARDVIRSAGNGRPEVSPVKDLGW